MTRSKVSTTLYLVLVFLSGCLVGAFSHRLYVMNPVNASSPEEFRRKYVQEMRSRVHLSEAQVTQLNEILDATRARYREQRETSRPALKIIHDDQVEKIRAMLTEAQRPDYEKLREEMELRRQQETERRRQQEELERRKTRK